MFLFAGSSCTTTCGGGHRPPPLLFCRAVPANLFLRAYAAHTRDYFPFTRKDRTSAFCIVLLFYVRSREWTKSILQTFCKDVAGLLSPRPRFLSSRKERNQRFAKEEVSSLESSLRGTSPRELRLAKFSPPDCSASRRMSGVAPTT